MRFRISFKTLTLLLKSNATVSLIARYFMGRVSRARIFAGHHRPGPQLAEAIATFEESTQPLAFSHKWFDGSIALWVRLLAPLKNNDRPVEMLEIGSWEGRSTVFLLGFLPGSRITAVDTWEGGDEHREFAELSAFEQRFDNNLRAFGNRVIKKKGLSSRVLAELAATQRERFDFVYVDGSHFADDVMVDAVLSWRLLRASGIMIFDDYLWRIERYGWGRNPAKAVNLFLSLIEGDYDLLHVGHQLAIRKTVSLDKYTDH